MLLLLPAAFAVDRSLGAEPPPERIVRASFVGGDASYQRGDAEDWSALGVNTPLMTGDSLYTSGDARAEVSLSRGGFARLSDGTQLDLVSLTADVTQLGLESGRLSVRVRSVPRDAGFEVDTAFATATISAPGLYRISVDDRGATYEVVDGGMSVVLNGEQLDVGPHESLALEGSDPPTYEYLGPRPAGSFDDWVRTRDQRFEHAESARYVHPEVEGHENLDAHGAWRPHPVYGRVWIPAGVGPEWAPYQNGRWIWQDPYGWTWVSYEDWGWAPYHYGRWVSFGGTWAWVPPPPQGFVVARGVIMPEPVYAPALVAFIGGSNWNIGVSVGGGSAVGWVPLAPAETYTYPWQPTPTRVVRYTNVTVVNAVTVVNVNNFVVGGGSRVKVSRMAVSRAPVMGCSPRGIAPTPQSLHAYPARRLHPGAVPVRKAYRRPLVARLVPPPRPMPFKEKVELIRTSGRPVSRPVAFDGDVGKPYQRGARVPKGVNAVSALSPERPAKPMARRGGGREAERGRSPRPVERNLPPAPEKSVGRPGEVPRGPVPHWQRGQGAAEPPKPPASGDHGGSAKPAEPAAPPGRGHRYGTSKPGENEAAAPGREPEQPKAGPPQALPPPQEATMAGGEPGREQAKQSKGKKSGAGDKKKKKNDETEKKPAEENHP